MKISRFNEVNIPKWINTTNRWSIEKVKNFFKDRDRIVEENKQLVYFLELYFYYNPDVLPSDEFIEEVKRVKDEYDKVMIPFDIKKINFRDNTLIIEMNYQDEEDRGEEFELKDDDLKDFIDFTQNPEIYFDAKKYNL
jgi:hypothetical protein